MKIRKEDIAEKLSVCVYCYEPQGNHIICCDENHFEDGYLMEDGEIYLESDVIVEDTPYYEIEERLMNKKADEAYDKWKDEQC